MAADSVTFRLEGEVTIAMLSAAITRFSNALDGLQVGRIADVRWVLSDLDYGSAIVTAQAIPRDETFADRVPSLVEDFMDAARAVQTGFYDRSQPLLRLVRELTDVAGESNRVVIESAEDDVVFIAPVISIEDHDPRRQPQTTTSLGSVRGRVETLSHRKQLMFTVYELATDRPVKCYLQSGSEERMRDAWGRVADVTGVVVRIDGRPLAVRRVSDVEVVDEGGPNDYRQARGVAEGREPSESIIRRIRDAS